MQLKKGLPEGVSDCLPLECGAKRELIQKLKREFFLWGYDEIETPTFEYYDVFVGDTSSYLQENMIKFFDLKGRIMVLRPDITVPIARIAATKLMNERDILRLCYVQNAFGVREYNESSRSEYTQAGVELLGLGGCSADAEVISLAIHSILTAGLQGFKLDIGHAGYFKGLVEGLGLNEQEIEELRKLIDTKNTVDLEFALTRLKVAKEDKERILALPELFGEREVIAKAREIGKGEACQKALDNLEGILDILEDYGFAQYLSIDLSMLHNLNYYSGVIFRGITNEIGVPVLSGGRYDTLLSEFGRSAPAVGFAMGIKRMMIALEKQGNLYAPVCPKILVVCERETRRQAIAYVYEQRKKGISAVLEQQEVLPDGCPAEYERAIVFGKEGKKEYEGGEGTCK